MDFDHVRGSKVGNVSEMLGSTSLADLLMEIAKCDVVCANCHRLRTYRPARGPRSERADTAASVQLRLVFEERAAYDTAPCPGQDSNLRASA